MSVQNDLAHRGLALAVEEVDRNSRLPEKRLAGFPREVDGSRSNALTLPPKSEMPSAHRCINRSVRCEKIRRLAETGS